MSRPAGRLPRIVALVGIVLAASLPTPARGAGQDAASAAPSAAERLAAKHAPILYIAAQSAACDADGDPFEPAPVEVVLDDPKVALREPETEGRTRATGPTAVDLSGRGEDAFLDYPPNPRRPGCDYERRYRARIGAAPAVAYAHVVADADDSRLALQYWFFYYFNQWNNTHEGDWEMVQLLFDVGSVEAALGRAPVGVAYAQHAGGEAAEWTDEDVAKEGDRPVVHVSAGSHASYLGREVYLGYGEDGAGFGCDDAAGPSRRVPVEARLVPPRSEVPGSPAAWLTYAGRWGERQASFWNGPTGPNTKPRWDDPFAWADDLRGASVPVPNRSIEGPDPVEIFCAVIGAGATFLNIVDLYPAVGYAALGVAVALVGGVLFLARRTLAAAAAVYVRHLPTFAPIGLVLLPLGVVSGGLHALALALPPVDFVLDLTNRSPASGVAQVLAIGGAQQAAVLLLIGPAVIQAVGEIGAGRSTNALAAYRAVWRRFDDVARAALPTVAIVFVLALSVVGLPWAVRQAVRWAFVNQAVVLGGAGGRRARAVSDRVVAGRWWRTLGAVAALALVGVGIAPLVGIGLMLFSPTPISLVGVLSGAVYAATVPFAVIGATLLYADRRHGE